MRVALYQGRQRALCRAALRQRRHDQQHGHQRRQDGTAGSQARHQPQPLPDQLLPVHLQRQERQVPGPQAAPGGSLRHRPRGHGQGPRRRLRRGAQPLPAARLPRLRQEPARLLASTWRRPRQLVNEAGYPNGVDISLIDHQPRGRPQAGADAQADARRRGHQDHDRDAGAPGVAWTRCRRSSSSSPPTTPACGPIPTASWPAASRPARARTRPACPTR